MNLNPDKRQEVRRQKVNNNQSKFQVGKSVDLICQHEALNIFEEKYIVGCQGASQLGGSLLGDPAKGIRLISSRVTKLSQR